LDELRRRLPPPHELASIQAKVQQLKQRVENPEVGGTRWTAPEEFYDDTINYGLFLDPVYDIRIPRGIERPYRHVYEKADILEWIKRNGTSPKSRAPMEAKDLRPDILLMRRMAEFYDRQIMSSIANRFRSIYQPFNMYNFTILNALHPFLNSRESDDDTPAPDTSLQDE
jgi:hypothetical protein